MVQKFSKNDPSEAKFFAVWEAMIEQTFADLTNYFDNVNASPALGNALWEASAVDVWEILEKSFFIKIFDTLVTAGFTAGAIDTYCRVLYALFGETASIAFTRENPLDLTIDVTAQYENLTNWMTKSGFRMFTKANNAIMFKTFLTDIPRSQLLALINAISNAGTKINFNLN